MRPTSFEQREVLHVARADLEDVRVSATRSTCPGSITSVMIGRPVSLRASSSICKPSTPSPWKAYGEVRGLNAPPRRKLAPDAATAVRGRQQLLAALDRARPGHDHEFGAADRHTTGVDDRIGRVGTRDWPACTGA